MVGGGGRAGFGEGGGREEGELEIHVGLRKGALPIRHRRGHVS